jgi:hypothetical protein
VDLRPELQGCLRKRRLALGRAKSKRIGNLNSQREHRVQFHWTVADQMLQGRTVQELHYDEGFLTVLADLVDRAVNRLIVGENLSSSIARILRAMIFFFPFRSV